MPGDRLTVKVQWVYTLCMVAITSIITSWLKRNIHLHTTFFSVFLFLQMQQIVACSAPVKITHAKQNVCNCANGNKGL